MNNNTATIMKIDGSDTSVAIVKSNGTGQVVTLQTIANQVAAAASQDSLYQDYVSQIATLGLTLPAAQ